MLGILFMMILRKMVSLQRLPTQIKTKYKDIAKRPILKNQPALRLNDKSQSTDNVFLRDILGIVRSRSITNAMSFMGLGRQE